MSLCVFLEIFIIILFMCYFYFAVNLFSTPNYGSFNFVLVYIWLVFVCLCFFFFLCCIYSLLFQTFFCTCVFLIFSYLLFYAKFWYRVAASLLPIDYTDLYSPGINSRGFSRHYLRRLIAMKWILSVRLKTIFGSLIAGTYLLKRWIDFATVSVRCIRPMMRSIFSFLIHILHWSG